MLELDLLCYVVSRETYTVYYEQLAPTDKITKRDIIACREGGGGMGITY